MNIVMLPFIIPLSILWQMKLAIICVDDAEEHSAGGLGTFYEQLMISYVTNDDLEQYLITMDSKELGISMVVCDPRNISDEYLWNNPSLTMLIPHDKFLQWNVKKLRLDSSIFTFQKEGTNITALSEVYDINMQRIVSKIGFFNSETGT